MIGFFLGMIYRFYSPFAGISKNRERLHKLIEANFNIPDPNFV